MWYLGHCRRAADRRSGSALVVVLMGMMLLSAVGLATMLLATADTQAAANQRDAAAALYAAEAGLELVASELAGASDWDAVLSGGATSVYADGPPSGSRTLPGGGTIRLEQIASLATCGAAAGCSAAARQAVTADRPWGANNPDWKSYRHGRLSPGGSAQDTYVVVLVGDDPSESDGNPEKDGVAPGNPGAGVLMLRVEAFGPGLSRRSVEAVIARVAMPGGALAPRFLSWREVR
jgi:Tfp pilus assembly protein PilX